MAARRWWPVLGGVAAAGALAAGLWMFAGARPAATPRPPLALGVPLQTAAPTLGAERLRLAAYLANAPHDTVAAARLGELALREARVSGRTGLVVEAERALRQALAARNSYEAERVLAAVLLSQHRFGEASRLAQRLLSLSPNDAWLHGVVGDAALERGDYDAAFAAFDAMSAQRPDAAAYARVAYARELQGDLTGALQAMQMALTATSPHDAEAQAWQATQVASLEHQLGRPALARRAIARALHSYPDYPPALALLADVQAAAGDLTGAAASLRTAVATAPAGAWHAQLGDVLAASGASLDAERAWARADAAYTSETPDPREHALFLAMRKRDLTRALEAAEQAARGSDDIVSAEAHAWAAFQSGDLATAQRQIARALRTGSRLRRLRYHAAAISAASGDLASARTHLRVALAAPVLGDLVEADAVSALASELGLARLQRDQEQPR